MIVDRRLIADNGVDSEISRARPTLISQQIGAKIALMFELAHLRAFVAVATELHFGRAAARLHISQSPLSRQVQALERVLNVSLLVRTSRSVRLTSAGHAFLREAQRLLEQAEAALLVARRSAQSEHGAVAIGLIGASTYDVLPRLVSAARHIFPHIQLSFKEMLTPEQLEALAIGEIDIGLGRLPAGARGVLTATLARERLVLAAPQGHALTLQPHLQLDDLGQHPFIAYDESTGKVLNQILEQACIAARFTPNIIQRSRQTQTVLSLVSAGAGIALVPETARRVSFSNVAFCEINLVGAPTLEMHAVWRPENDNPALPAFLEAISEIFLAQSMRPKPASEAGVEQSDVVPG